MNFEFDFSDLDSVINMLYQCRDAIDQQISVLRILQANQRMRQSQSQRGGDLR